jgi:hypothetical protein
MASPEPRGRRTHVGRRIRRHVLGARLRGRCRGTRPGGLRAAKPQWTARIRIGPASPEACGARGGQAGGQAVDKHCFLGRTAHVLWMNCGWLKNLEMRVRNPLCGPHRRRRTALTTGDGYRPGGDLGDVGRVGKPALAAGIRDRRQVRECQAAEQSVRGGCRAGRGPSISYMEGPPPILPEEHPADRYRHAEDCGEQAPGEPGRNAVLRPKYPAIRLPTQTRRSGCSTIKRAAAGSCHR